MLDSRSSWSASNHDDIWELIPWYVNGSMTPEDMALVKRHIDGCAECTVELSRQRTVAARMSTDETYAHNTERSWKKLSAQIRSERNDGTTRLAPRRRFGVHRKHFLLAGACAAACLVAIVNLTSIGDGFHTLSSSTSDNSMLIKFQTASVLAPGQLEAILAEHALELLDGPSQAGVYTAAATRNGTDPHASAKALMTAPQILFAAPVD